MNDDLLVANTSQHILAYLASHPESADTLEGIHYYWIESQESLSVTQEALSLLLETGSLERLQYGHSTVLWRRARI